MKISEGMKRWIEFCRNARIHNLYLLAISNRDKKEITIPGSTPTPHPYPDPFFDEPGERLRRALRPEAGGELSLGKKQRYGSPDLWSSGGQRDTL
jgi:hypothetical protein